MQDLTNVEFVIVAKYQLHENYGDAAQPYWKAKGLSTSIVGTLTLKEINATDNVHNLIERVGFDKVADELKRFNHEYCQLDLLELELVSINELRAEVRNRDNQWAVDELMWERELPYELGRVLMQETEI